MPNIERTFVKNPSTVAENVWDVLGLVPGSPTSKIVESFRRLTILHAVGDTDVAGQCYQDIAIAYRFLCSIPLSKQTYNATDILPLLRPLDDMRGLVGSNTRACAMIDVSMSCMERAQVAYAFPYVNYVLNVHYCMRKNVVRRRYGEFLALHLELQKKIPVIPRFPEKTWFEKFSMSAETAKSLTLYLNRLIKLLSYRRVFSLDLMAFLEIDFNYIRAEEEGILAQMLNDSTVSMRGVLYIVHAPWLEKWKSYVTTGSAPPGPITNHELFDVNQKPKKNLFAVKDYRFLSQKVWTLFHMIYRGGPEITRNTNSIYGSRAHDMLTAVLLVQRLTRGFLARKEALRRKTYVSIADIQLERKLEAYEDNQQHENKINKIKKIIQSEESAIVNNAARKIQTFARNHNLLQQREEKEKDERTDWMPLESCTLSEVMEIENNEHRLAQFIFTMKKGVSLNKVGSLLKRKTQRLFRISNDGSHLEWCTGKNTKKSILLASVVDIHTGLQAKGEECEYLLTVTAEERKLCLSFLNIADRNALAEGLNELIKEGRQRMEAGAYMDSYGALRRKKPHAKKLVRRAESILQQQ